MNQKNIGTIVLILGVILASLMFFISKQETEAINSVVQASGSCFLDDGTCLHQSKESSTFIGTLIAIALLTLGAYLIFFDKTQQILLEQHSNISKTLQSVDKKDKFGAFLSGFNEDEKIILKTVYEQEGITQATLRYKTGLSKTQLSLVLASLEKRGIITKKPSGKTNKVFIRKKF